MELEEHVHALIGQRCTGADNPVGSVIRLDIGELGLGPLSGPKSKPHGWRHLTVESPWRIQSRSKVLWDWNTPGGVGGDIEGALRDFVGATIMEAEVSPPGWDLRLVWSNGLEIVVFSDSTEDRDDAWSLLGTDGLTLTAGPQKGDGPGWTASWAKEPQIG